MTRDVSVRELMGQPGGPSRLTVGAAHAPGEERHNMDQPCGVPIPHYERWTCGLARGHDEPHRAVFTDAEVAHLDETVREYARMQAHLDAMPWWKRALTWFLAKLPG